MAKAKTSKAVPSVKNSPSENNLNKSDVESPDLDLSDDDLDLSSPSPTENSRNQKVAGLDTGDRAETVARVYKNAQVVDHDLFKLVVAKMQKKVSYDGQDPAYEAVEHTHFFHTVDSNGRRQQFSTPTGGHFHEIVVMHNSAGVPHLEVGPPLRWVKKKVKGRSKRYASPVPSEIDSHKHKSEYLGSQRITLRTPNMEAAKVEAAIRAKQEPSIDGVIAK